MGVESLSPSLSDADRHGGLVMPAMTISVFFVLVDLDLPKILRSFVIKLCGCFSEAQTAQAINH